MVKNKKSTPVEFTELYKCNNCGFEHYNYNVVKEHLRYCKNRKNEIDKELFEDLNRIE